MLAATVIVAAGIWIDGARDTPASRLSAHDTPAVSNGLGHSFPGRKDGRTGAIDLYGNPIEEAVGDYRIDTRGGIFERHSPATEISRLADPST